MGTPVADPLAEESARQARRQRTACLVERLQAATAASDSAEVAELRHQIVVVNAEVARALARRFRGRGVDLDDLEQTAYVALVRVVNRYAPGRGHDLLDYAVPSINGELKRAFRDGWTVRVPRRIQETQHRLSQTGFDAVAESVVGNARIVELAAATRTSFEDVRDAVAARGCFTPTSLDVPMRDGRGPTLSDLLPDDADDFASAESAILVREAYGVLSARERLVLYLRYVEERTQSEIGLELGVTQMQVSRLLTRIHRLLRDHLTGVPAA